MYHQCLNCTSFDTRREQAQAGSTAKNCSPGLMIGQQADSLLHKAFLFPLLKYSSKWLLCFLLHNFPIDTDDHALTSSAVLRAAPSSKLQTVSPVTTTTYSRAKFSTGFDTQRSTKQRLFILAFKLAILGPGRSSLREEYAARVRKRPRSFSSTGVFAHVSLSPPSTRLMTLIYTGPPRHLPSSFSLY